MSRRICVVTAGHLSTTPRMVKAADALAEAGYRVRMVSTRFIDWATRADGDLRGRRSGSWRWQVVDYSPAAPWTRLASGLRLRAANAACRLLSPSVSPVALAASAYCRVHRELVQAILAEPEELIYAGTRGAMAAAATASRKSGVPFALDLEDFYTGEQDDSPEARHSHSLARRIETRVLPEAAFLTAGSQAIADAYRQLYQVDPIAVHNTFSLPRSQPPPAPKPSRALRLYWFSQTIGPRRGLEDAVLAAGKLDSPCELHLRGVPQGSYLDSLKALAKRMAPELALHHHEPAPPDRMIELASPYDVGLALEQGHVPNRALCLTNKPLTYILAGLAVAFTDTPGQRPLAGDLGDGAILYRPGDVDALAEGLAAWAESPRQLERARAAAWQGAVDRWHWEHPLERGALLSAVAELFARQGAAQGAAT